EPRMSKHPEPLALPADATDAAVRRLVTARFSPGTTLIGVTAPTTRHPGIHCADHATPRIPHCGQVSHSIPQPIRQILAATDSPDAQRIVELLRAAGIDPCRMCRRCWPNGPQPRHDRIRCFSIAPSEPRTG